MLPQGPARGAPQVWANLHRSLFLAISTHDFREGSSCKRKEAGCESLLQSHGTFWSLFALRTDSRCRLVKGPQPGWASFRAGMSSSHCCCRGNALPIWTSLAGRENSKETAGDENN